MSEFSVSTSTGRYAVSIELGAAAAVADAAVAIVDPVVATLLTTPPRAVVALEANESRKTLASCEEVLVELNRRGLRRGEVVAAVGGGVVQDVATLSCSLYMRGVPWVYVPTTLMAMADSCIGGKSSINAGGVKNLVGNIYPPARVAVDPVFVATLPTRDRVAGLAEAVKICFARGQESFDAFVASPASLAPDADDATAELIATSLQAKRWFVEIDEFDRRERQLLNFGHSFGHAWEAACGFSVPHGVAVAVGMLAALHHPAAASSPRADALRVYVLRLLVAVADEVAAAGARTDAEVFRRALATDKKNSKDLLRLVLPGPEGDLRMTDLPLDATHLETAWGCLERALEDVTR